MAPAGGEQDGFEPGAVEVALARNTARWVFAIGTLPALATVGSFVGGMNEGTSAASKAASAIPILLVILLLEVPFLPLASVQLFGRPRLVVDRSSVTIHHRAIFRDPVRIERDHIHSVYVELRRCPSASSGLLPSLAVLAARPNLLIVFTLPLPMGQHVRRGLGLVNATPKTDWHAPTRRTCARGLTAIVEDPDLARAALLGWPTSERAPEDVLEWLQGGLPGRRQAAPPVSGGGSDGPAGRRPPPDP